MKYALCETKQGWVGIGIEDGSIRAATLGGSRAAAQEELVRIGAVEPADAVEATALCAWSAARPSSDPSGRGSARYRAAPPSPTRSWRGE